jgi:hypothetical protein
MSALQHIQQLFRPKSDAAAPADSMVSMDVGSPPTGSETGPMADAGESQIVADKEKDKERSTPIWV